MLRKAKVVFYTMNSGFPVVVVVVVAIFKMMLIVVVVVVVIFLGEELPLSSFRFVYLQFSVSCCLLLLLLLLMLFFGSVFYSSSSSYNNLSTKWPTVIVGGPVSLVMSLFENS